MRTLMAMVLSGVLLVSAGIARADEQAVKEHDEMGKKGVTPEMMKDKDKQLSAKEREEAKKRHMEQGTKGVTPHAMKKKQAATPNKDDMKKHEEMGKKGVYPEGKPEANK